MNSPHWVAPLGGRTEIPRFAPPELISQSQSLEKRIADHDAADRDHQAGLKKVLTAIGLSSAVQVADDIGAKSKTLAENAVNLQREKIELRATLWQAASAYSVGKQAAFVQAQKSAEAKSIEVIPGDANDYGVYEARKKYVEQHTRQAANEMHWWPLCVSNPMDKQELARLEAQLRKEVLGASGTDEPAAVSPSEQHNSEPPNPRNDERAKPQNNEPQIQTLSHDLRTPAQPWR